MQLDRLYTTSGTTNFDFDTTAAFMSLPADFKSDMGDQYLMGYCDAQHMPACCTPVYFNQTAENLSFLADYSQNYGFGFAIWGYTGGAAPGNLYYIDGDDNIVRSWGVNYDFAFINRGEMCRVNANPTVEIFVEAIFIQDDFYDGDKCTRLLNGGLEAGSINNLGGVWLSFTFTDFVNMIVNDAPIVNGAYTGTGGAAGVTFNITVRPSDFGDSSDPYARHYVTWDAGNGYYVYFCIEGVRMSGNTPVYYNETSYPANIVPFFMIPHTTDKKSIIVPGSYIQSCIRFRYENGAFTGILQGAAYGYNQATDFVNNAIYGGFNNGTLSVNDVNFSEATLSQPRRNVFFINNFYGVFLGSGLFRLYPLYTPRDIYNYLCLYHKHTSAPSDSYSSNDIVTVFDPTDAPTFETVSGTLSEIAARLRPWQIPGVDITSNNFSPEDIPEPTPPEPGDEDDTGDSITRPSAISVGGTNGFVTQYVLTAAQIAALGRGLWAGVADRAFWDNWIWTALLEAGTFNVSDILQFFISLRVYPFSLINVSSYQGTGSAALWLGRGTKAIDLGTQDNLGTISQYADILDAGSLTVPAYYADFRDYDHVSITLHAPYIGTINLAPGDVVGAALHLFYAIDFASGSCTAYLDISRGGIQYPICIGSGVIGADVPLSADSAARRVAAAIDLGFDTVAGISAVFSGDPLSAAGAAANMAKQQPTVPTLSATGKGFDSFAGAQTAYIQIRRGKYAEGKTPGAVFKSTYGEQLDQPAAIGSFTGFTKFVNVDTAGLQCDDAERSAILTQLQSGVYI